MALRWETKRPAEVRTYKINWSTFLGADTIASRTTTATGVTIDNGGGQGVIDGDLKGITLKLSGGTSGTLARVTNTIVTTAGETETEKVVLFVSDYDEPVSLAQAKAQCRVLDTNEDALIEGYIRAAREWVEEYTGHILVRRPVTQAYTEFWTYLELYHQPVVEVVGISYTDASSVAQTILPAALLASAYPYRIRPADAWPTVLTYSPVTVSYVAGYNEGEVPQALVQAMLLLIGHWHTTRGGAVEAPMQEAPLAVASLCDRYRVPVL